MDFNSAIDIIIKDLEEARSIIDDLKKYPGVPVFQVELARSKCKGAAEILALLKNIQNNYKQEVTEAGKSPAGNEEIKPARHTETKKSNLIESWSSNAGEETEQVISEISDAEKVYGPGILADKFSHEDDEYLKSGHLTSLSEAIGINDRFLFLKELFNHNKDLYIEVISRLDQVHSIEEARSIIKIYSKDESSREAGKQLLDLVKRKLRSDE